MICNKRLLSRFFLENQGQILPFASILKNYKSYKSTQWEQRARSDPSPNTQACLQANSLR